MSLCAIVAVAAMALCSVIPLHVRDTPMFTQHNFAYLRFLEGRWQGHAPDGSYFYERYDFPAEGGLRSRRFPDD